MPQLLTAGACSLWRNIGHSQSCLGLRFARRPVALCKACQWSVMHHARTGHYHISHEKPFMTSTEVLVIITVASLLASLLMYLAER